MRRDSDHEEGKRKGSRKRFMVGIGGKRGNSNEFNRRDKMMKDIPEMDSFEEP